MKKYDITIGEHSYEVSVESIQGGIAKVSLNGEQYEVAIKSQQEPTASTPTIPHHVAKPIETKAAPKSVPVPAGGRSITAPLPGVIIHINVNEGQQVRHGQKLAVLEAMKMENDILSEYDGVVSAILVQQGDSVLEGATIMTIE